MRLKEFQLYLRDQKIDLAFFVYSEQSQDPTIPYFAQMKPSHGFMLIGKKAELYLTKLDHHPNIKGILVKHIPKKWSEKFTNKTVKKIGINKQYLTVGMLSTLKKVYPKAKFVDVSEKLDELRSQKTKQEIKKIQKACTVTTNALTTLVKELPKKKLKTERDVAFFLEKYFYDHNCGVAFPTIVAMGKNAAIPHHHTGTTKLKRGFLLIDFGASVGMYNADCTRVLFLGTPTKREKEWYSLLQEAQQTGVDAVKSGMSFKELDAVSRNVLGKYKKNFTHSLGHGIGVEVHEAPVFSNEKSIVKENMVFTIEPGIYFPGKFGLRIEDTVVWDGKVKILTGFTKKLIILEKF